MTLPPEREEQMIRAALKVARSLKAQFRLSKEDLSDIIQDTNVKLLMLHQKGEWPDNVEAWFYRAARNRCLDWFDLSDNRQLPLTDEVLETLFDPESLTEQERASVEACIARRLVELERRDQDSARIVVTFRHILRGASLDELIEMNRHPTRNAASQYKRWCLLTIMKWVAICRDDPGEPAHVG